MSITSELDKSTCQVLTRSKLFGKDMTLKYYFDEDYGVPLPWLTDEGAVMVEATFLNDSFIFYNKSDDENSEIVFRAGKNFFKLNIVTLLNVLNSDEILCAMKCNCGVSQCGLLVINKRLKWRIAIDIRFKPNINEEDWSSGYLVLVVDVLEPSEHRIGVSIYKREGIMAVDLASSTVFESELCQLSDYFGVDSSNILHFEHYNFDIKYFTISEMEKTDNVVSEYGNLNDFITSVSYFTDRSITYYDIKDGILIKNKGRLINV